MDLGPRRATQAERISLLDDAPAAIRLRRDRQAYAAGFTAVIVASILNNAETVEERSAVPTWKVDCWNCDEGYVEPIDEWDSDVCCHCKGKGYLVVTELTDDNCESAFLVADGTK